MGQKRDKRFLRGSLTQRKYRSALLVRTIDRIGGVARKPTGNIIRLKTKEREKRNQPSDLGGSTAVRLS